MGRKLYWQKLQKCQRCTSLKFFFGDSYFGQFFEKNYPGIKRVKSEDEPEEAVEKVDFELTDEATIKLAVKSLMEVVESPKNIEIATMKKDTGLVFLDPKVIEELVDTIEKEQAKEKEDK